jgi:hypothetical protein
MLSLDSTTLLTSHQRFSPTRWRQPRRLPDEQRAAQRLACRYLTQACERALFDLRSSLRTAGTPGEVRSGLAAADILSDVLLSWRDALAALD